MITIWKTMIETIDQQQVTIPDQAKPIHVGQDPQGIPSIWWECDSDRTLVERTIWIVGTGNPRWTPATHIGSFVIGLFIWHVYTEAAE